jgi:hypothetical protein
MPLSLNLSQRGLDRVTIVRDSQESIGSLKKNIREILNSFETQVLTVSICDTVQSLDRLLRHPGLCVIMFCLYSRKAS